MCLSLLQSAGATAQAFPSTSTQQAKMVRTEKLSSDSWTVLSAECDGYGK